MQILCDPLQIKNDGATREEQAASVSMRPHRADDRRCVQLNTLYTQGCQWNRTHPHNHPRAAIHTHTHTDTDTHTYTPTHQHTHSLPQSNQLNPLHHKIAGSTSRHSMGARATRTTGARQQGIDGKLMHLHDDTVLLSFLVLPIRSSRLAVRPNGLNLWQRVTRKVCVLLFRLVSMLARCASQRRVVIQCLRRRRRRRPRWWPCCAPPSWRHWQHNLALQLRNF
mmetsp:Transcript_40251/g.125895  ORF Transcript_40251/g.125895 Transcript_40251/m.125895 type:complete len:224 (+) Transcript_40251:1410-2081(+)